MAYISRLCETRPFFWCVERGHRSSGLEVWFDSKIDKTLNFLFFFKFKFSFVFIKTYTKVINTFIYQVSKQSDQQQIQFSSKPHFPMLIKWAFCWYYSLSFSVRRHLFSHRSFGLEVQFSPMALRFAK